MTRVCENCGNTQGPFARIFVGFRKTGRWLTYCPIPAKGTPEELTKMALACTERAEKRHGAA